MYRRVLGIGQMGGDAPGEAKMATVAVRTDTRAEVAVPAALRGSHGRLHYVLGLLAPEVRAGLLAAARMQEFTAGSVVVSEGQTSDRVGYVLDGALGMQKRLLDGRTHLIGLLVPTDMYGRLFDGPATHDLVALADTRVFSFERTAFERAMTSAPEVERRFLVSLLDELDAAREWILLLGGHRVTERVASFLLVMLRRSRREEGAPAGDRRVRIPISRRDLAHHLGARPESISRAFHHLQKVGAIDLEDAYTVRIADLGRLAAESGADLIVEDA
jgi:CRP/FNR family transcriptional regulator